MRRTGTSRRSALTATGAFALGAVLTGCGGGPQSPGTSGGTDARTVALRAEKALRASAARDSVSLLSRYEQAAAAHPVAGAGLAPLQATVREHLTALGGPAKAQGASPAPAPPAVPTDARTALKELASEERRVADARTVALLDAGPELARLLASVAAAGAAHAYLLTELAKEPLE